PLQNAASLFLDFFNLFGALTLGFEQNVLGLHTLWKRVLFFVLLEVLSQFIIGYFDFWSQFKRLKEDVFCFSLLRDVVLRLVLIVVIALVFFRERDFVL